MHIHKTSNTNVLLNTNVQVLYVDAYVMMHASVMQGKEQEIIESLAKYVTDEYKNKCEEIMDTSEWPRRYSVCI